MNSEEQTAPPPGVAVVTTPEGVQQRNSHTGSQPRKRARNRKRHRNRNRKRNHNRNPNHNTTPQEDRPPVTEGTQLHQARQNHSTFDRVLHHRSQGGTGYGMKRDHVSTELELSGRNIPEALLPSYAHSLARMGITVSEPTPHHPPLEAVEPSLTDAQQQAREEQQMRQAHEKDQQNPTESK
jgi:uncharacterized membrane protein YdbT with pleckstrin-like domain